jgi:kinetochore protein Nuf2
MSQVGILDFSIRDLIKPDAQRVKKILSAIINFAKFREEQLPVFDKHTERSVNALISRLIVGIIRTATQRTGGSSRVE